jgi:nucleotide-binding universal stress UspA family protein
MDTYDRILVPVDLSPPSREAAAKALGLARCLDSEVEFLHVSDNRAVAMGPGHLVEVPQVVRPPLEETAVRDLDEFIRGLDTTGVRVTRRTRVGVPFQEILAHIADYRPAMIVMGTHGRTGIARAVLGSQAEMVVRGSPVPVLVVHARPEK